MEGLAEELATTEQRWREAVQADAETSVQPGGEDEDAEARERRRLGGLARFSTYVRAAIEGRAARGPEAEYNAALGIAPEFFPLRLLAPAREERATTDADTARTPRRWLDRLFSMAAAMDLGVTFESVQPGTAAYPVTTAGATAAQRGREEAAADAPWALSVAEIKPTRNAVSLTFTAEDAARLPGLEDALVREGRAALVEGVDRAIFIGDAGADENPGDIVGLTTAAGVVERTITQANKVKAPETLAALAALVDGKHASAIEDLRVVASVGANTLWLTTVANAAAENQTIAQFLRASGLSWMVRGGHRDGHGRR